MDAAPIIETMLWSNLRAVLLVALVYGALRALRTSTGDLRHAAWLAAVAGCLILPLLSAVLPPVAVPLLPPETVPRTGPTSTTIAAALSSESAAAPGPWTFGRALVAIYALGVVIVLGHFVAAVRRLVRLERTMVHVSDADLIALSRELCDELRIRRRVDLLQSDLVGSPFTWGVWRPRVVLPGAARDWSRAQLRNVLLHELCHVRRFDWLRLCLRRTAVAMYWLNPSVWLAARQCAYEAERACDDFVLRSGGRSSDYAEQLVELMASSRWASSRSSRAAAVALGDRSFAKRIRAILSAPKEARFMSKLDTRAVTTGVALAAVGLAAFQITSAQPATDEQQRQAVQQLERQRAEQERQLVQQRAEQESQRVQQQAEQESQRVQQQAEQESQRVQQQAVQESQRVQQQAVQERQVAQQRSVQQRTEQALEAQEARRRAAVEVPGAARSAEQLAHIAALRQVLDRRELALRETQAEMRAQEQALSALRASLDEQRAALIEQERAVVEVRLQLEELDAR